MKVFIVSFLLLLSPLTFAAPKAGLFDTEPDVPAYSIVDNTVYINSEIVEPAAYAGLIKRLDNCTGTLHMYVTTPGGNVQSMYMISDAMVNSKCVIQVTVRGMAASAGAIISISGDTLELTTGSVLMFHSIQVGIGGPANLIALRMQVIQANYKSFLEQRATKFLTPQEVEYIMSGGEVWINQEGLRGRFLNAKRK